MSDYITKKEVLEKTAVFSKDKTRRFELTIDVQGKKGKSIFVLCLNPATEDISISDTTTNYLLNNLIPMGYSSITICNLFSMITSKLNAESMRDNEENMEYIKVILQKDFNTILIGYGNTFAFNKTVVAEKLKIDEILEALKKSAVELIDKSSQYSRLKCIHPLFAGQRFSGEWKFRKYMPETKQDVKKESE